jgi:hypothetical protein
MKRSVSLERSLGPRTQNEGVFEEGEVDTFCVLGADEDPVAVGLPVDGESRRLAQQ